MARKPLYPEYPAMTLIAQKRGPYSIDIPVIPIAVPINITLPTISGVVQEGKTLTATAGAWSGDPTEYEYQWYRNGVPIAGSINLTRILTAADIGNVMRFGVYAVNAGGRSLIAMSAGTVAVIAAAVAVPVNSVAPVVSGDSAIGSTLTTTNGTWSGNPTSYTYQWRRNGENIDGATNQTYKTTNADALASMTCRVAAVNAGGSAPAVSNAIAVANVPPPAVFTLAQLPADTVTMDLDPANAQSMTLGTTVGTEVKAWRSVHAGAAPAVTYSQAGVDGLAPRLNPTGWDGALPSVLSDGTNDFLLGDGPYGPRQWHFLVAERATTNNVNTQNSKAMFGGAESNGGRYGRMAVIRQTQNTTLDSITFSGLGTTSLGTRGGFTVGRKMVLFYDLGRFSAIDGVTKSATPAASTGTTTNTYLFGTGSTDNCMGMKLARHVTIDPTKLHGSYDNGYATAVIAGYLAWKYGTQEALSATHFFKNRAPMAADFSGFNPSIQTWGNSIGNGSSGKIPSQMFREGVSFGQRGNTLTNGCTGGHTPAQIENAFTNGLNLGQGLADGVPVALQRDKMVIFAEMFANAPNAGEDGAVACLQRMVPLVEQAQGVAAGQARLMIWAPWSSWTGDIRSANRQNTIATMRNLWPNYVYDIEEDFYQLGAPSGPYPDETNYAAGRPPNVLKESNGTLHPNDTGYTELGKLQAAWIVARNFDI